MFENLSGFVVWNGDDGMTGALSGMFCAYNIIGR